MERASSSLSRRALGIGAAGLGLSGLEAVLGGRPALSQAPAELRIAYGTVGATRHPYQVGTNFDVDIARLIFDGLLAFDEGGGIVPLLAESYQQTGDARWRFKLRPNVRFHSGAPLGAEDVLASLAQFKRPDVGWSYFYTGWFDRGEKVDDLTVDIVATKPHRLAIPIIAHTLRVIPRSVTDPKAFESAIDGTGRYRLTEFVPNNRVVLDRNEGWWGEKPWARRIVVRHMPEASTRLAALESGDVDLAALVPVDEVARLKGKGFALAAGPAPRNLWIGFNFLSDAPIKDVRVRQALNYAVDREGLNQALYGGLGAAAHGPISRPTRMSDPIEPPYSYDPGRAKRMLAEAGLPNGFSVVLATPNGRYPKDREIAEVVAAQLAEVGVKARIEAMEWATYTAQMRADRQTIGRRYGLFLLGWSNPVRDPDLNLVAWDSANTPWNLGTYKNEALDAALGEGRVTMDESKATAIYRHAQEIVWREPPGIFLVDHPNVNVYDARIAGLRWRGDEVLEWELARRSA